MELSIAADVAKVVTGVLAFIGIVTVVWNLARAASRLQSAVEQLTTAFAHISDTQAQHAREIMSLKMQTQRLTLEHQRMREEITVT